MQNQTRAILNADPGLSRFDPLPRIIYHDDFNRGLRGWVELIGNYEDSLDSMLPPFADLRPPMLSSGTHWDTGTHGAMQGTYSLKLATRPRAGDISVSIKRVEGKPVRKWQFKRKREPFHTIGGREETVSHFHLAPDGWEDVPDASQELCYNEIATKYNWYYLRMDLDLATRQITHLQCNDHIHHLTDVTPMMIPAMPNLACMLNVAFWVETDTDKRAFLYLDSVLLSGEW